jgi:hypothetical protein
MQGADLLSFKSDPAYGWDFRASADGSTSNGVYKINLTKGETYDISSSSFFEPHLEIFDENGKSLGFVIDDNYGSDYIFDFAPKYTGIYYISPGWSTGSYYKSVSLNIYHDIVPNIINHKPTLVSVPPTLTWTQGERGEYVVPISTFSDPDDDAVSYKVTGFVETMPKWLTFDPVTRTLSGTPPSGAGLIFLTITGTDPGGLSTDVSLYLNTVKGAGHAPTIGEVLKAATWAEGKSNQYVLSSIAFLDSDGDALTYSASQAGGAALPSWLSFNAATKSFTGTPPAGSGDFSITVTAKDPGGLSASQTFAITTNQAPTAAQVLQDLSWTEGAVGAYILPPGAFVDLDGSVLTLSAKLADGSALPNWLGFLPSNRLLTGTPPTGAADLRVVITATDAGGLTASSTFTLSTPSPAKDALPIAAKAILRDAATDQVTALINQVTNGVMTNQAAVGLLVAKADATTSVATLSYQFFTGKIPGEGGIDYLVSATGPNGNNLNSTYYQSFNLENRYINFAVNLGTVGEGKTKFQTEYGALTLEQATKKAYGVIFGGVPTDAKVAALLAGGRDAYLESFGPAA